MAFDFSEGNNREQLIHILAIAIPKRDQLRSLKVGNLCLPNKGSDDAKTLNSKISDFGDRLETRKKNLQNNHGNGDS